MSNDNPLEKKRTSYGFRAIVLAPFIVVAFLIATDVMSRRESSSPAPEEPREIRQYTVDDLATPWEDWRLTSKEEVISPEVQRILDELNLPVTTETRWHFFSSDGRNIKDDIWQVPGPDNAAMAEVIQRLCTLPRETKVGIEFADEKIPKINGGYQITRQFKRFYFPHTYRPINKEGCTYEGLAFEDITRDEFYGTYASEVIRLESYFGEPSTDKVWFELDYSINNGGISSLGVVKYRTLRGPIDAFLNTFTRGAAQNRIAVSSKRFSFTWRLGI